MLIIANLTFGVSTLIYVFIVIDLFAIFDRIVKVKWFKKERVIYYKIGFTLLNPVLLFSYYLPMLSSVKFITPAVRAFESENFGNCTN